MTGLGEAQLFDVTCTLDPKAHLPAAATDDHSHLRALRLDRKSLQNQKHMREKEARMLARYGETLSSEHVQPKDAIAFMESFVSQSERNSRTLMGLEQQIQGVQEQIRKEKLKISEHKGNTYTRVGMVVATDQGGPVQLKLTYSK